MYLFIYLITSTMWWGTHNRARLQFKCVLADNPPSPGEVYYTTGVYVPTLFEQCCGFFYVPQEQISKSAERWDLRFLVLIQED